MMAVESGRLDAVELLIKRGVHLNRYDTEGNTALHMAAKPGFRRITEALVEASARITVLNSRLKSPLDLAIENKSLPALVRFLQGKVDEKQRAEEEVKWQLERYRRETREEHQYYIEHINGALQGCGAES